MNDTVEEVKDFVDEIMDLFSNIIEIATIDFKDYEIKRKNLKEELIKIFEIDDKI